MHTIAGDSLASIFDCIKQIILHVSRNKRLVLPIKQFRENRMQYITELYILISRNM